VWAANVSNPWQPTLLVRVREYTAGKKKEEPATLAVGRESETISIFLEGKIHRYNL
jgi:hypothetical protein